VFENVVAVEVVAVTLVSISIASDFCREKDRGRVKKEADTNAQSKKRSARLRVSNDGLLPH